MVVGMTGHIPPVLYSADFKECAAISEISESEIAELFVMVLRCAGATIVHTTRMPTRSGD
jgi:hypothetical protein